MRLALPRWPLALLCAALVSSCEGTPPATPVALSPVQEDSLAGFIRDRLAAFAAADWDRWTSGMADSAFWTAAEPGRALMGRDTLLKAMRADYAAALAAGLRMELTPDSIMIWSQPGGQVAVATAPLDFTISLEDRTWKLPLRSTSLLARDTAGWRVLVEHVSRPIGYDSLFGALLRRQVPGPVSLNQEIPPGAGELVTQFRRDYPDFGKAVFAEQALVVTPGEIVRGAEAAREAVSRWMGPAGNPTEPGRGVLAGLAPGATVGWVASILYVPIFAGPESYVAPIRTLIIYQARPDHWEIVAAHLSVGTSQPLE